jgi:hypothetical protein
MTSGQFGGQLEPDYAAAIRAVANPDNWRGLTHSEAIDLQNEINKNLTKEQQRTVSALVRKRGK